MLPIAINFLFFVFIPLGIFFVLGWFVFYHLEAYGLQGDASKRAALFFAVVLILISAAITMTFFSVDWNNASINDFLERSRIYLSSGNGNEY